MSGTSDNQSSGQVEDQFVQVSKLGDQLAQKNETMTRQQRLIEILVQVVTKTQNQELVQLPVQKLDEQNQHIVRQSKQAEGQAKLF